MVPDCLGTMLFPLVILTSYVKLQPLDGDDQDRVAVGGMSLTSLGDAGAPGQAVQHNKNKNYIATTQPTIKMVAKRRFIRDALCNLQEK